MCAGHRTEVFLVISKPESFSNITDPEGTLVNTRFLTLFGKALRGFIHVFQGQNPGSVVKGRLVNSRGGGRKPTHTPNAFQELFWL